MTLSEIIRSQAVVTMKISQDVDLAINPKVYFGATLNDFSTQTGEYNRVCLSTPDLEKLRDILNQLLEEPEVKQ